MTVDTTVHIHTAKRSLPTTNPQTHRHTYKYGRWDSLNCPSHTLSVYWRHVFLLTLTLLSNCFSNKIQLKRRTVIQWLKFYHWFPIGTSIRLSPRTGKLCFSLPHASPFSFTHTHTHFHLNTVLFQDNSSRGYSAIATDQWKPRRHQHTHKHLAASRQMVSAVCSTILTSDMEIISNHQHLETLNRLKHRHRSKIFKCRNSQMKADTFGCKVCLLLLVSTSVELILLEIGEVSHYDL